MSTTFLQQLIRTLYAEPLVSAAYLGGDLAGAAPDLIERVELHLAAAPAFARGLATWLSPLGEAAFSGPEETAFSGPDTQGWRVVTLDGVEWCFFFYPEERLVPSAGMTPLFDRRSTLPTAPPAPALDLGLMAGRFWSDLYRAARALCQGQTLTAHGHLEEGRRALVDLYRLAIAPGAPGRGWAGADLLAGVNQGLVPMREWLVAPLDLRAQVRSAHRLGAAYESLMLPLCQRLGVPYPMAMRNLAFKRLEQARSGAKPESEGTGEAATAPVPPQEAPAPIGRMRVAKGRIKR